MVEVLWICVDKDRVTSAARNLHNLRWCLGPLDSSSLMNRTVQQDSTITNHVMPARLATAFKKTLKYPIHRRMRILLVSDV
jgi:hypothetical protein